MPDSTSGTKCEIQVAMAAVFVTDTICGIIVLLSTFTPLFILPENDFWWDSNPELFCLWRIHHWAHSVRNDWIAHWFVLYEWKIAYLPSIRPSREAYRSVTPLGDNTRIDSTILHGSSCARKIQNPRHGKGYCLILMFFSVASVVLVCRVLGESGVGCGCGPSEYCIPREHVGGSGSSSYLFQHTRVVTLTVCIVFLV